MSPRKTIFILCFLLSGTLLFSQNRKKWGEKETHTLTYNICSSKFRYDLDQRIILFFSTSKDTFAFFELYSDLLKKRKSEESSLSSPLDSFLYKKGLLDEPLLYLFPVLSQVHPYTCIDDLYDNIFECPIHIYGSYELGTYKKAIGDTIIYEKNSEKELSDALNIHMYRFEERYAGSYNNNSRPTYYYKGIFFPIKSHKTDLDINKSSYMVKNDNIEEYKITFMEIDTSTFSRNYPIFHYKIGGYYQFKFENYKVYSDEFLYLAFCPQIGILSYRFPQAGVTIDLESINGMPVSHYVNSNRCITPFCGIK